MRATANHNWRTKLLWHNLSEREGTHAVNRSKCFASLLSLSGAALLLLAAFAHADQRKEL